MEIFNEGIYEQKIFNYPINIDSQNFSPLASGRVCNCTLVGSINCYYCNHGNSNVKYTSSTEYKGD